MFQLSVVSYHHETITVFITECTTQFAITGFASISGFIMQTLNLLKMIHWLIASVSPSLDSSEDW